MPISQSDSLSWPNNVNTTIQADQRGSYQNIAQLSAATQARAGATPPSACRS
jgi:hypothetical protein